MRWCQTLKMLQPLAMYRSYAQSFILSVHFYEGTVTGNGQTNQWHAVLLNQLGTQGSWHFQPCICIQLSSIEICVTVVFGEPLQDAASVFHQWHQWWEYHHSKSLSGVSCPQRSEIEPVPRLLHKANVCTRTSHDEYWQQDIRGGVKWSRAQTKMLCHHLYTLHSELWWQFFRVIPWDPHA